MSDFDEQTTPETADSAEVEAPEVTADSVPDSGAETTTDQAGAVTDETADADARPSRVERLENEGEIAADYLEGLLDIADLDGDLDMDVEGDRAAVSIVGAELQQLVGKDGRVLDALQDLTRLAVYRETGERSRLMLDVSGFRAERRERLTELATEAVAEVKATGRQVSLDAMSSFERKVVHDAVAAGGLVSESEGAEPHRFVVILPE